MQWTNLMFSLLAEALEAFAPLSRGFDVDVYEQASELKEVGAGLQLSPNGSRVLFGLGLKEQIESLAAHPTGKEIRLWNTGQTWKPFDLGTESVAPRVSIEAVVRRRAVEA